jgi:hypothetical protein
MLVHDPGVFKVEAATAKLPPTRSQLINKDKQLKHLKLSLLTHSFYSLDEYFKVNKE